MPRTLRPTVPISGLVTLFLFGSVIAAIAVSSTKVMGTPRNEFDGTAEGGVLAYAQSRAGHPNRFDAYLKRPALPKIKINRAGTQGYHPNIDLANPTLGDAVVFVQKGLGDADLKIWDLNAGHRDEPPAGVNTQAGESKPSLDGNFLLFGRYRPTRST